MMFVRSIKNAVPLVIRNALRDPYNRLCNHYFPPPFPEFSDEIPVFPEEVVLYTNLKCLAACPHCCLVQADSKIFHGNKFMSGTVLRSILQAPWGQSVKSISMAGGEALQHPELFDWCTEAQATGLHVQIVSNGMSYADDTIIERLITNTVYNNLHISLDAVNERDYAAAKGLKKAPYAKICENIKRVATHYKSNDKVKVAVSFVMHAANAYQMAQMVDLAISLNVDSIYFHCMHIGNEQAHREVGDTILSLPKAYKDIMKRTDYGVSINIQPPMEDGNTYYYCKSLDEHLVVGPDGAMSPCCHMPWNKKHGVFQDGETSYDTPSIRTLRHQFIAAQKARDPNLLPEHCRQCNRRLHSVFQFTPETRKWSLVRR